MGGPSRAEPWSCYREWYGASKPEDRLKWTAEQVAAGVVARETDRSGRREDIAYGVLDPSAFAVQSAAPRSPRP